MGQQWEMKHFMAMALVARREALATVA